MLLAAIFGLIGVVMAAPLLAAIMVVAQMLYVEDRLGDASPGAAMDQIADGRAKDLILLHALERA